MSVTYGKMKENGLHVKKTRCGYPRVQQRHIAMQASKYQRGWELSKFTKAATLLFNSTRRKASACLVANHNETGRSLRYRTVC